MIWPPALLHRYSNAVSRMAIAANTATTRRKAIPTTIAKAVTQPAAEAAGQPCLGFQVWPSHQKSPSGDSHCLPSQVTESAQLAGAVRSLWQLIPHPTICLWRAVLEDSRSSGDRGPEPVHPRGGPEIASPHYNYHDLVYCAAPPSTEWCWSGYRCSTASATASSSLTALPAPW